MKDLEKTIKEIVKIAESCPEPYRAICFELLLKNSLGTIKLNDTTNDSIEDENKENEGEKVSPTIKMTDLHIKTQRFFEKYSITEDLLNNVYYQDNKDFLPLFDNLGTTRTAESQIRIGLLQALVNAMKTGNFEFDGEAVRSECQERKAYDSPNFTRNFTNNTDVFDGFVKYKKSEMIKLSEEGKKRLAELIRELAE